MQRWKKNLVFLSGQEVSPDAWEAIMNIKFVLGAIMIITEVKRYFRTGGDTPVEG